MSGAAETPYGRIDSDDPLASEAQIYLGAQRAGEDLMTSLMQWIDANVAQHVAALMGAGEDPRPFAAQVADVFRKVADQLDSP